MSSNKSAIACQIAGEEMILDSAGCLFWPKQHILMVADLHLEKSSYYATRGNPLPLYDSIETLTRLKEAIIQYKPNILISLGDNLHDMNGFVRMSQPIRALLESLLVNIGRWEWIIGNHDKDILDLPLSPEAREKIHFSETVVIQNIHFRHDFMPNLDSFQIVGHYHPCLTYQNIRGKCFLEHPRYFIMPAFGQYTGGLNVHSPVIQGLCESGPTCYYLIYRHKVWQINPKLIKRKN